MRYVLLRLCIQLPAICCKGLFLIIQMPDVFKIVPIVYIGVQIGILCMIVTLAHCELPEVSELEELTNEIIVCGMQDWVKINCFAFQQSKLLNFLLMMDYVPTHTHCRR